MRYREGGGVHFRPLMGGWRAVGHISMSGSLFISQIAEMARPLRDCGGKVIVSFFTWHARALAIVQTSQDSEPAQYMQASSDAATEQRNLHTYRAHSRKDTSPNSARNVVWGCSLLHFFPCAPYTTEQTRFIPRSH